MEGEWRVSGLASGKLAGDHEDKDSGWMGVKEHFFFWNDAGNKVTLGLS
jgi:hypothetical protein